MSRKHTIPGVDEAALSELARQFPSHEVVPPAPLSQEPPPAPAVRSGSGSRIAVGISVIALVVAAVPVAAPFFRAEVAQWLGDSPAADALVGGRIELERRMAAEAAQRTALERATATRIEQLTAEQGRVDKRLETIEAVGGGGFDAAARRVETAETAVKAAMTQIGAFDGALGEARTGLAALQQDVVALKGEMAAVTPAMQARLAEFEPRLAGIEQRAASLIEEKAAGLGQGLASVQDQSARAAAAAGEAAAKSAQVEKDFAELRQFNRSSVRLFLIALHLRTAVQTPAPFAREVAAVRGLVGDNPEALAAVGVLNEHANGIRTISDLRDTFLNGPGPQIKALAAGLDATWASRLTAFVAGPQMPSAGEGERVWRVVMEAERALQQGNLAAAINNIDRFDGAAGAAVAGWLRDAKARLAVESAAASLSVYALNQLMSGS